MTGKAEFYAAERIGFDEIHKFPENFARRKLELDLADGHWRDYSLEQAADGAGEADVHLGDAEFGVAVGALVGEVNVVYANYFSAVGVNDLLVEEIFAYGEPGFIRLVKREGGFVGGEGDAAGRDRGDLIVASD